MPNSAAGPPGLRRTKIVCTLGPSTDAPGILRRLIEAGLNVARINAAHGSEADHAKRIADVRRLARANGRPVAVLLDLPGPKLRLGKLRDDAVELRLGTRVVLASGASDDAGVLPVRIPRFAQQVRRGQPLALADGSVRLRADRIDGARVHCTVEVGGTVRSGSGINLPETQLSLRLPTADDERWIEFAVREKVDWLGVSFVRGAEDVVAIRRRIRHAGEAAPAILAKIEKRQALDALEAVIAAADGVMVARGDLGVETPLAEVPVVQKRIIAAALRLGRPVVTATQMLESMTEAPTPTRAEVADVANAVLDGSDAVMLSGETAVGRHPVRAVETLRSVILATEPSYAFGASLLHPAEAGSLESALSAEAVRLAEALGARAILVPAKDLARVVGIARLRPRAPILAYGAGESLRRRLAIVWGNETIALPPDASVARRAKELRTWLGQRKVDRGGRAVLLSTSALEGDRLDTLRVVDLVTSTERERSSRVRRARPGSRGRVVPLRAAARRATPVEESPPRPPR